MTTITFSTIEWQAMYPIYGVPQLHHDQLNIIAKHIDDIKHDGNTQRFQNEYDLAIPIVNKLTRKDLKNLED